MAVQRKSGLSADAAIGIVFSAVVAFGLAVSYQPRGKPCARWSNSFMATSLTVSPGEIVVLFAVVRVGHFFSISARTGCWLLPFRR